MADLSDTIESAAGGPQTVSVDGLTTTQRSIPDLVQADQYLNARDAAAQPHRGLRFTRILAPNAVD